ncbi:ninein isoform X1 [Hemiscyllium ocellatum]|uniref:ninein isoform X1 n=1 Tax=Hemiscyllium ocellatum TaxID=170820 RepID=UPI0029673F92|nr:ninein isoform X1 [Hemiscyllium ocellatum]
MDEAEQDKYEARLKEVFDSFDTIGTGSLGREELTDLCHMLQLQEVAPVLLQSVLQGNLSGRVHFEQFKEALIFTLSTTIEGNFSGDDGYQALDSTEVQPKYVKDGKRYGRRTAPEFQDSVEEFMEVRVTEPLADETQLEDAPSGHDIEKWKASTEGEEYEAEGQLRFWNPDDLNTSQCMFGADPKYIEERLQAVSEELGVTKDSYLSSKELISICDQCGLQNVDAEILDDIFQKLDQDGLMRLEDFIYGIFKKSTPSSASTPYRQLKRHHSQQPFDESGRRTATPSAMTSTIGLRLFSCLDDGTGYTSADQILDTWQDEGIENGLEILKTLDFDLYGKVNLTELTLALENELLITKNGIHQAVLASFKNEIRHLKERVDQVLREKEKLRMDLEKAEKLKNLMASEVDDRHAAIEHLNECNLRKLEQEYRHRFAALKADLTKEKDQIFHQASKQRTELEKEIEKMKVEDGYLRDRLALSLKENSRLEKELIENSEKLFEFENLAKKLQNNLDTILKEKFGDLDPTSAEFFLHEEKFTRMRKEYEQQCRELQDRIDELQSELQAYQTQGRSFKPLMRSPLSEEMESKSDVVDCDQGFVSEECNPLNMSLEAEMVIEQIKEQHHQAIDGFKTELDAKVNYYEEQINEIKVKYELEKEDINQEHNNNVAKMNDEFNELRSHISELQEAIETLKILQHTTEFKHKEEKEELLKKFNVDKTQLEEQLKQEHEETLQIKLKEVNHCHHNDKEELLKRLTATELQLEDQRKELKEVFLREKRELEQIYQTQVSEVTENLEQEKEELQRNLLHAQQNELLQERKSMENKFNHKIAKMEAQFAKEHQTIILKFKAETSELEEKYQHELLQLEKQLQEEKGQWEFEKEELLQESEGEKEKLKEMLKEKSLFAQMLMEERDSLEKSCKDELNKLASEHQQLQKELEELKFATSKKESILTDEIISLKKELNVQLQKEEEQLAKAGHKQEQTRVLIEQVKAESEKQLNRLKLENLQLEEKHSMISVQLQAAYEECDKEKAEYCSEISRLQEKIKNMEEDMVFLGEKQRFNNELEGRSNEMKNKIAHLQEKPPQLEVQTLLLPDSNNEDLKKDYMEMRTETLELEETSQPLKGKTLDQPNLQKANQLLEREKTELMKVNTELQAKIEQLQGKLMTLTNLEKVSVSSEKEIRSENSNLSMQIKELEEETVDISKLQKTIELLKNEMGKMKSEKLKCQDKVEPLQEKVEVLTQLLEESQKELAEVKFQNMSLKDSMKEFQEKALELSNLRKAIELFNSEKLEMIQEKVQLQEKVKQLQDKVEVFSELEIACEGSEKEIVKVRAQNTSLRERTKQLEEKVVSISELHRRGDQTEKENAELKVVVARLQEQLNQQQTRTNSGESEEPTDANDILKDQKATLREEEGVYHEKIIELNEVQQELKQQVEILQDDKITAQRIIELLNNQMAELRSQNKKLDAENEDLCHKNSKNQADVLELKQRLAELIRQKEKRAGNLEKEREQEKMHIMQEIENGHLSRYNKLEDEVTALKRINENLTREKEALNDEVKRCVGKITKMNIMEMQAEHLRQEWQTSLQEVQKLSSQLMTSQEKIQSLEESSQSINLQTAKLKSDFRVAQQENEALKQEVMSLHKQLQTTKDKNQMLELTLHSADFQHQQKKFYQNDLARLVEEEQKLLRQENERLQKEGQQIKGELQQAREKIKHLESTVLTLKQQKHYSRSATLKAAEQEKLCLKKEYDQIQKDLNRRIKLIVSLEHELKVLNVENEMLRKKQSNLESQLMETGDKLLQSNSSLTFSQSQNLRELQQLREQICTMVPKDQLAQLQQCLSHEEVQRHQLQEQLDKKVMESNTQQEAYERLLKKMEERMQDVENKLRNMKLLLQDKVMQQKEQLSKNAKADEKVKDLYVENAQLLKALEMSEQRQKTTEKKNYLLEENIAGLNKILKDLSASSLSMASTRYSS